MHSGTLSINQASHGHASHVGKRRAANEDFAITAPTHAVITDGMGGHTGGAQAARFVGSEVHREFVRMADVMYTQDRATLTSFMQDFLTETNESLRARFPGAGTTVAAVLLARRGAAIWHAGDSRVYQVRENRIRQLTADHNLAEAQRRGGVPLTPGAGSILLNCMGVNMDGVKPDVCFVQTKPGDRFILTTDGTHYYFDPAGSLIPRVRGRSAAAAAQGLVDYAVDQGGHDNATAAVLDVP